jgi:hypothetical protein
MPIIRGGHKLDIPQLRVKHTDSYTEKAPESVERKERDRIVAVISISKVAG